jgi:hypothetical protein
VLSFMRQPSLLAAAAAVTPEAGGPACCFDPVTQHKAWCPWVHLAAAAAAAGSAAVGHNAVPAVPALALGWSSTLLAVQEQLEEQQLQAAGQQGQEEAAAAAGQIGGVPKPGQFDSTAAVLARARQVVDALD